MEPKWLPHAHARPSATGCCHTRVFPLLIFRSAARATSSFRAANQHQGLVVARRILRRRAAASNADAGNGGGAAELAGGTIARSRARHGSLGAECFITLWIAVVILPEDAQVRAVYDLLQRERGVGTGGGDGRHRRGPPELVHTNLGCLYRSVEKIARDTRSH